MDIALQGEVDIALQGEVDIALQGEVDIALQQGEVQLVVFTSSAPPKCALISDL